MLPTTFPHEKQRTGMICRGGVRGGVRGGRAKRARGERVAYHGWCWLKLKGRNFPDCAFSLEPPTQHASSSPPLPHTPLPPPLLHLVHPPRPHRRNPHQLRPRRHLFHQRRPPHRLRSTGHPKSAHPSLRPTVPQGSGGDRVGRPAGGLGG